MSNFDEAKIRRASDGKFANKDAQRDSQGQVELGLEDDELYGSDYIESLSDEERVQLERDIVAAIPDWHSSVYFDRDEGYFNDYYADEVETYLETGDDQDLMEKVEDATLEHRYHSDREAVADAVRQVSRDRGVEFEIDDLDEGTQDELRFAAADKSDDYYGQMLRNSVGTFQQDGDTFMSEADGDEDELVERMRDELRKAGADAHDPEFEARFREAIRNDREVTLVKEWNDSLGSTADGIHHERDSQRNVAGSISIVDRDDYDYSYGTMQVPSMRVDLTDGDVTDTDDSPWKGGSGHHSKEVTNKYGFNPDDQTVEYDEERGMARSRIDYQSGGYTETVAQLQGDTLTRTAHAQTSEFTFHEVTTQSPRGTSTRREVTGRGAHTYRKDRSSDGSVVSVKEDAVGTETYERTVQNGEVNEKRDYRHHDPKYASLNTSTQTIRGPKQGTHQHYEVDHAGKLKERTILQLHEDGKIKSGEVQLDGRRPVNVSTDEYGRNLTAQWQDYRGQEHSVTISNPGHFEDDLRRPENITKHIRKEGFGQ